MTPRATATSAARPKRLRARLLRFANRLERHRMLLGLLVVAAGVGIGVVAWSSVYGVPWQSKFPFVVDVPADTPPLQPGDQLRVAGKIAGVITSVTIERRSDRVAASLDPGYAPLGRGASIHVSVLLGTSLVYFVVDLGNQQHPLRPGVTIPARRVAVTSSLSQDLDLFNAATRATIARDADVLGAGVSGRGLQTNAAIADLDQALTAGVPLLQAATRRPGALSAAIGHARDVTASLAGERPDDVGAATDAASRIVATLADRRTEIGSTIDRFARVQKQALAALPLLDGTLTDVGSLAAAFEPGARAITAQLPDLVHIFSSGPELLQNVLGFKPLAESVLRLLGPIATGLRDPAGSLEPLLAAFAPIGLGANSYASDLGLFDKGLIGALGGTVNGRAAVAIAIDLGCNKWRDPYPAPGQALKDRRACL